MPAPSSNLISRSPNEAQGPDTKGLPQTRLSAGPPRAPLKSAKDPADQSTLDMLGANPLDQQNGGAVTPSEAGGPGMALGAVAMMLQGAQLLSTVFPGMVPPEVALWLDNLMQVIPQAIQQQQSGLGMMGSQMGGAGVGGPMGPGGGGMGQGGAPAPPPGAALGPSGPPSGASQPQQRPARPPM